MRYVSKFYQKMLLCFRVNLNHITMVDGMGFSHDESKQLLINCPELYKFKVELALQSS